MFATLHRAYPIGLPDDHAVDRSSPAVLDRIVAGLLAEQASAGLGLLTDGGARQPDPIAETVAGVEGIETGPGGRSRLAFEPAWRGGSGFVDAWRRAALLSDLPVKACLVGPYTLGRQLDLGGYERRAATLALARTLRVALAELADDGCPFVQVDEPAAIEIGDDPAERRLFVESGLELLDGLPDGPGGFHRSLAISGGDAEAAGAETIFAVPYDSHFFDLIAGPDNWRLITRAPAGRGIVCGAIDAASPRLDAKELVIWAALYAASTGGRGVARIGVAPSGSLAGLPRDRAQAKIAILGTAARIIEERDRIPIASQIDPRATDLRSAATGRWVPPSERPKPRRKR